MPVALKPHQQTAVDKMHNGCILWGGVGTGKSITALAYYFSKVCKGVYGDPGSMRTPKDVYVITTAKKRNSKDWEDEAFRGFGLTDQRDASSNFVTITVDSWNNIDQYLEVEGAFFIFDEQRVVGSGAWAQSFIKIAKRNEWVLLSATPGDTWMDYIPVFIANGWYKNRTEFMHRHVIFSRFTKYPKVERYVEVGLLVKLRNKILVHMPFERHTVRHIEDIVVPHDELLLRRVMKDRWHVYEERPLKDAGELVHLMRKVVNSSDSRIDTVRMLAKKHPRLIVFYNFDPELEKLRSLKSEFVVAEYNGHKHEKVPDGDSWIYLVQYTAGAEGWNCTTTNAICFFTQTYSYKQFHQAHGRIDRLNTPYEHLFYYNILTNSLIDDMIKRNLLGKRSFNQSQLSYLMPVSKDKTDTILAKN